MRTKSDTGSNCSGVASLILSLIALGALVAFQQSYSRSHEIGIEQPVGLFGMAEYFFRHPERLFYFSQFIRHPLEPPY